MVVAAIDISSSLDRFIGFTCIQYSSCSEAEETPCKCSSANLILIDQNSLPAQVGCFGLSLS